MKHGWLMMAPCDSIIRVQPKLPKWFSAFAVSGSSWLPWHPIGVYRFAASCPAQFPMRTPGGTCPGGTCPFPKRSKMCWMCGPQEMAGMNCRYCSWVEAIKNWMVEVWLSSHFWSAFGTPCLRYAQQSVCLLCHQLSLARHAAKPVASSRHAIQPGSKLLGGVLPYPPRKSHQKKFTNPPQNGPLWQPNAEPHGVHMQRH